MSNKFRRVCRVSLAIVMCVCLTNSPVSAQRPGSKPNGGGIYGIALRTDVQKEIGIDQDTDKIAKIRQLSDVVVDELKELRAATKGDVDKYSHSAVENIRMKHKDKLKQILSAPQYQRLQQIHWQMTGYPALIDPDLIDGLRVSPNQIEKIVVANREYLEQYDAYMAKVQKNQTTRPGIQEIRNVVDGPVESRNKKIEEVLTPSQREKFVELQGEPFK